MQEPRPIRHDMSPAEIEQRWPDGPPSLIPYRYRYYAGIVVSVLAALIGFIQLAGPADLGFSPVAARWLGVIAAMLVFLAGPLPNPFGGPRKPPQEKG